MAQVADFLTLMDTVPIDDGALKQRYEDLWRSLPQNLSARMALTMYCRRRGDEFMALHHWIVVTILSAKLKSVVQASIDLVAAREAPETIKSLADQLKG